MERQHPTDQKLKEKPMPHPQGAEAPQEMRATPWELARERIMHPNQPIAPKH